MADHESIRKEKAKRIAKAWAERNGLDPEGYDLDDLVETLLRVWAEGLEPEDSE